MKKLGNFLWFIFGGFLGGIVYFLLSVVCCATLIGIPVGKAFFRLSKLSFAPFGKDVSTDYAAHPIGNTIWHVGAIFPATIYAILGVICCVTLIGIPFGKQFFKLTRVCANPFGSTVD